ncbi:hypothetical protein FSP39_004966 [Pinctada imbricata]|uniref:EF-hand domain-containing protein n=1 Tax=Pinctada imbricata TaxID=66713 RepID=A0AA89BW29_PINIB|nr:hypothetical protein FSP39_004966 [Pinctada imbricata]
MGQKTSKEDKKLMNEYDLTKEDLEGLKAGFNDKCTRARVLTKTEFRELYGSLFPGDAVEYADEMFRIADTDDNGQVDFTEFVRSLCLCDSKNIDDKIKIAFKLYDRDNSGTISKAEVRDLLKAYSSLIKDDDQRTTERIASDIFHMMDEDQDEEITFEEFSEAAKRYPDILNVLSPKPPDWQE